MQVLDEIMTKMHGLVMSLCLGINTQGLNPKLRSKIYWDAFVAGFCWQHLVLVFWPSIAAYFVAILISFVRTRRNGDTPEWLTLLGGIIVQAIWIAISGRHIYKRNLANELEKYGYCGECCYDLEQSIKDNRATCPECGWPIPAGAYTQSRESNRFDGR